MTMIFRILVVLVPFVYVYWHLWLVAPLPAWGRWMVVLAAVLLFGVFVLGMSNVADRMPLWLASACYNVGSWSMIVMLYLFIGFLLVDVLRLCHAVPRGLVTGNWWACGAVLAVAVAVCVGGHVHYRHKCRQPLALDSGGRLERPVRLVGVSDLHIGYHNRRAELARWVDMLNAEHPDAILVAGDIIDRSLRPLEEERMWEEFRRLEAPVYACLGNHEYFASEPRAEEFYRRAGITLLRDSVATVAGVTVIGRDDRSNPHRLPLSRLAAGTEDFTVLLDHQPYHLEEAEQAGVDFQFSGHTHDGQVWPVSWVVRAMYECGYGSHRRGATRYYVTSGLGIWGPTLRIGTRSEYLVVDIR